MNIDRAWAQGYNQCPDCKDPLNEENSGVYRCSCRRLWVLNRCPSVKGKPDEITALDRLGFQETMDVLNNVYYVLPAGGHIIHLYADGTWFSDKATPELPMKDYLAGLEADLIECKFMP